MQPLQVENLKAGYGSKIILENVSFTMEPKEIRAVLGGSGCGKSTLLNTVLGLEKAKAGRVAFFGDWLNAGKDPIPDEVRRKCGVLFQNGALLSSLTVEQNIALPLRLHRSGLPKDVIDDMVAQKLASVGMLHAWGMLPSELSGGMRKRAALARAIILDPGLLFCDEPSAGLDPITSRSLDELLLHLRDTLGLSILIVTHELDSIKGIADRLLFLANKGVHFDGTLRDALEGGDPLLEGFFARRTPKDTDANKGTAFQFVDKDA